MIIQEENIQTSLGGQEFKIKASAKAFKILSSNLYKDKPLAICRELMCNAYDSHIAAGKKDVPIQVTVPTVANPTFVVEDFGLGLSKDEVEQIYTTYFESTKSQTNDMIGGLGLGSKSPFAYTTTFTVIATKDGIRNTFLAFIGDGGTPQITLLSTAETDAPNGVRVEVPVQSGDYHLFRNAAMSLVWFDTMPTIIGANQENYKQHPGYSQLHDEGYGVSDRASCECIFAVMGTVAYPIDLGIITRECYDVYSKIRNYIPTMFSIYVKFDIGELDIAPSREELSYDASTQAAIQKRFEQVLQSIINTYNDIVNDIDLSVKNRVRKLCSVGITSQSKIYTFIASAVTASAANQPEKDARWYYIDNTYRKERLVSFGDFILPQTHRRSDVLLNNIANNKSMLIVTHNGKPFQNYARRILNAYNTQYVVFVDEADKEFRKYIDTVFGCQIITLEQAKAHLKSVEPPKTSSSAPRRKHPDDRIVLPNGSEKFLKKDFVADKTKFITDSNYYDFYDTLFPRHAIIRISKTYAKRAQQHGFDVLDCERRREYTDAERDQIISTIASSMEQGAFGDMLLSVCFNDHEFHNKFSYYNAPQWPSYGVFRHDIFRDRLVKALDIPAHLTYNTDDEFDVKCDMRDLLATYFVDKFTAEVIAIQKEDPLLTVITRSSTNDHVEIIVPYIQKG